MNPELDEEWAMFLAHGYLPQKVQPTIDTDSVASSQELEPATGTSSRPTPLADRAQLPGSAGTAIGESDIPDEDLPKLTISTQSNNARLNNGEEIDVKRLFWALRVMPYIRRSEGIIKKQMKIRCATREQLASLQEQLKPISSYKLSKVEHIDEPGATTTFKYVAKLSIGVASKEIKAHRAKETDAFFNSFTMVLRLRYKNSFKEIVTKVFNKGILSLPGMLDQELLDRTLMMVNQVLGEASLRMSPEKPPLQYKPGTITDVMVNSNFWCGFGLDRDKLVDLMVNKYHLETTYDPSNYPGVACRYYTRDDCDTCGVCPCNPPCSTLEIGNGKGRKRATKVGDHTPCLPMTFMMFRTGSVLIVGRCANDLLSKVHKIVARMLLSNKAAIQSGPGTCPSKKNVRKKSRKRLAYLYPKAPEVDQTAGPASK